MGREILGDDSLIIAIERGDELLTPHGTTIGPEDVVTVLSRSGDVDTTLDAFADGESP